MSGFVFNGLPARVVFGAGTLGSVADELERLGASRALVLSTPGQRELAERVAGQLGKRAAAVHPHAVMHVPLASAERAREAAACCNADACVAIGGGSTIGLAKAIALTTGLPILAIPTTYAGSEMTPIYGLTDGGLKRTGRDPQVLPKTVIYDPELTFALPVAVSSASGINAIAHAVEALYAQDANPVVSLMAEQSIRALAAALPRIVANPTNRAARTDALYGAWLAGTCLGSVGMALHHKLCHTLGGSFDLPHAEVHSVVLPHAAHFNHAARPDALARVASALGAEDAVEAGPALFRLAAALGLPTSLRELGLRHEQVDEAATIATRNPYYNPRPVDHAAVLGLLEAAYAGEPPSSSPTTPQP